MTTNANRHIGQQAGIAKSGNPQPVAFGTFHSRFSPFSPVHEFLRMLSAVNRLLSAIKHRAIAYRLLFETPPISTQLNPISTIAFPVWPNSVLPGALLVSTHRRSIGIHFRPEIAKDYQRFSFTFILFLRGCGNEMAS